jgi:hypothetical protein
MTSAEAIAVLHASAARIEKEIKNREVRLRRLARSQGLVLTKARQDEETDRYFDPYFISDASNFLVSPEQGFSLDEVEKYLNEDPS